MKTPTPASAFASRRQRGFALIATLAIMVIVTVLVVAYATTVRTEQAASVNFAERDRAEAVALGMLNRLVAEHAVPTVNNAPLKPFALDGGVNSATGLPDSTTVANYYAGTLSTSPGTEKEPQVSIPDTSTRQKLQPIYLMKPDDESVLDSTGLVRVSKPNTATATPANAYNADFWAYDGLTEKVMTAAGATTDPKIAQPKTVPQWVDYYETDPATGQKRNYPTAKIAFAVWDEGGKLDINLAGEDKLINGVSPHDLQLEKELTTDAGAKLISYLNNDDQTTTPKGNGVRDRSNFSLRKVLAPDADTGDDRWVFSTRELIEKKLVDPNKFKQFTTLSRDFDARPEWDGNRASLKVRKALQQAVGGPVPTLGAEDFLRSYVNNPAMYGLFYGGGSVGPFLVPNSINTQTLSSRMSQVDGSLSPTPSSSAAAKADWLQVMRLLSVLRRALPPYADSGSVLADPSTPDSFTLTTNSWLPTEVWGVASNLVQATDAASDFNLIAYNPNGTWGANSYQDPRVMLAIRISPLITEATLKVKKAEDSSDPSLNPRYEVTQFIKVWNPYPYELKITGAPIQYGVHNWAGGGYPGNVSGSANPIVASGSPKFWFSAPLPGQFKVVRVGSKIITLKDMKDTSPLKSATELEMRMRPYLMDKRYQRTPPKPDGSGGIEWVYSALQMGGYNNSDANKANAPAPTRSGDPTSLFAYFSQNELPKTSADVAWYSYQIDDPRMSSIKRNAPPRETTGSDGQVWPQITDDQYRWSWIGYHNRHALYGSELVDENGAALTDPDITKAKYNGKSFMVNGKLTEGYNANFGTNWPDSTKANKTTGISSGDNVTFSKMMATFALPGRPMLNVGEIGGVFAVRPWVTLNFADKIIPDAWGTPSPTIAPPTTNKAALRPAAILDYFTTIGTPKDDRNLYYVPTSDPPQDIPRVADLPTSALNMGSRYQDKTWLFETVTGTAPNQVLDGNLRPIRGRINLNTAGTDTLTTLLKAPYRMPPSLGLQILQSANPGTKIAVKRVDGQPLTTTATVSDFLVTIDPDDAKLMAQAITRPITDAKAIRPLRTLSDLSQLYDKNSGNGELMKNLYAKYPQSVITAMIGRLAQFGTVRQQSYTIDMTVRMLNPNVEKRRVGNPTAVASVTTSEARIQARISFDTFTRKAFIESLQYR